MANAIAFPLSPKYEAEANKLIIEVEAAQKLSQIRKLFYDFAEKYTVIPELWLLWMRKENTRTFQDFSLRKEDEGFFGRTLSYRDINNFNCIGKIPNVSLCYLIKSLEQFLIYPHDKLEIFFTFFCERSSSPISTELLQKYKKALTLFKKNHAIVSLPTSTPAEWLTAFEEINDKKLIIENFECWIGKNPANPELWKVYLSFLKRENESQRLLTVLFRYCRLFLEDIQTKVEYQKELKQQGKEENKMRLDPIEFGTKNQSLFNDVMSFTNTFTRRILLKLEWSLFPTVQLVCDNMKCWFINNYLMLRNKYNRKRLHSRHMTICLSQNFALPSNIIYYMSKTQDYRILLKLYKVCKYFFMQGKIVPCHNFSISLKENATQPFYYLESFYASPKNIPFIEIKNIVVTNSFQVWCDTPTVYSLRFCLKSIYV